MYPQSLVGSATVEQPRCLSFRGLFTLFGREYELITGVALSHYTENAPAHGGWN